MPRSGRPRFYAQTEVGALVPFHHHFEIVFYFYDYPEKDKE
jgi:hypothetical protein